MLPWKLSHFSKKKKIKILTVLENNRKGAEYYYLFLFICWIFKMSIISVGLPALS